MVTNRLTHPGDLLVIDDDRALLILLRTTLREEGYRVLTVTSQKEAGEALTRFRVGLILTDAFRVPGDPDLWAGLRNLRVWAPRTPIVICSAHEEASFAGFAERGFAGLLTKPFDLDTLRAVILETMQHDKFAPGQRHPA